MKTPPENAPPRPPGALVLALAQMHAALDWQEYCYPQTGTKSDQPPANIPGLSEESLRETEQKFEGK
jgi:hypothetical protein